MEVLRNLSGRQFENVYKRLKRILLLGVYPKERTRQAYNDIQSGMLIIAMFYHRKIGNDLNAR